MRALGEALEKFGALWEELRFILRCEELRHMLSNRRAHVINMLKQRYLWGLSLVWDAACESVGESAILAILMRLRSRFSAADLGWRVWPLSVEEAIEAVSAARRQE